MHKIGQFLGRLLGTLLKTGLPLMKNVPKLKSILIILGLTTGESAARCNYTEKMFGSGLSTLIISSEEMNDIMKIVKSLEEPGLLIKGVSKTIKNKIKEQKEGFLSMLLGH